MNQEDYGFSVRFGGNVEVAEMEQWLTDSSRLLSNRTGKFSLFMDMTECTSLPKGAREFLEKVQTLYMENGMSRSVVVIERLEMDIQLPMKDACLETGAYVYCRYIDIKTTSDWRIKAMDWILNGTEPYP